MIFFCMDIPQFVHSSVSGRLGSFLFLVVMSKIAMNNHILVFTHFYCFWAITQTVFQGVCIILHSYLKCVTVPFAPHFHQYLGFISL